MTSHEVEPFPFGRGQGEGPPLDREIDGSKSPHPGPFPGGEGEERATGNPHLLHIRIYYEDTDAGGIVYHARYLAFAERARTELLRDRGVPLQDLADTEGLIFVVRRVKMDYLRPARLDDVLTVSTIPTELSGATTTLHQAFSVGPVAVARLVVQLACVRQTDGRPARIPVRWRQAFELVARSRQALEEVRSGSDG